jgi:hypothetical protein
MPDGAPRKVDRERWRRDIVRRLGDFPRQYAALENAMGAFGDDFDLAEFKQAFETSDDMDAYNRVQAVERAVGRVQNYVAELAEAGAKLAEQPGTPLDGHGGRAEQAFEAMRERGVIDRRLVRRLVRAQAARTRIEHSYVQTTAGDVHGAAKLVHGAALEFIAVYRVWIAPYLDPDRPISST